MDRADWADSYNGGRQVKPVPRWLPIVLVAVPLIVLATVMAAIYTDYDF